VDEILLLGSGGWIPTGRRETCCALLREGDHALVIDAGTGIRRLVEDPGLLDGVARLEIVLTHFHLDHVVGLSYLPALPLVPSLWGPGLALYDASTAAIVARLIGSPLFGASLDEVVDSVREVPVGHLDLGPFALSTRAQRRHTHPTLALRIDDAVTYCTDTAADRGNVHLAAGSRLLLHEAWYAQDSTDDETHSAAGEAGRVARDAGVERLVLIHVNPLQRSDEELLRAARAEFRDVAVGEDLLTVRP
jgi:ribonuclease BN (tRNA processing enzyme)